jgi:hypothetical protein
MNKLSNIHINPQEIKHRLWYDIDNKYAILFVLICLYYTHKISKEKFMGQIRALRAGHLSRVKGTHHCTINNKWYDHESPTEPYKDCLNELCNIPINVEQIIQGLMIFENKGYNYAINSFLNNYIGPFIRNWYPSWGEEKLSNRLGIAYLPFETTPKGYSSECDSCGSTHYEIDRRATVDKLEKAFTEFFHSQKKGNLKKIPSTVISIGDSWMW